MLMPMVLTLHDTEAYDRVVHLAQRLIVPLVSASIHERRNIDKTERVELDVEGYFLH